MRETPREVVDGAQRRYEPTRIFHVPTSAVLNAFSRNGSLRLELPASANPCAFPVLVARTMPNWSISSSIGEIVYWSVSNTVCQPIWIRKVKKLR